MSPGFNNQGVMTPPASENQAQFQHQQQQRLQAKIQQPPLGLPGNPGMMGSTGVIGPPMLPKVHGNGGPINVGGAPAANALYPHFQNHYEQLGKLSRPLLSLFPLWNFFGPRLIS